MNNPYVITQSAKNKFCAAVADLEDYFLDKSPDSEEAAVALDTLSNIAASLDCQEMVR